MCQAGNEFSVLRVPSLLATLRRLITWMTIIAGDSGQRRTCTNAAAEAEHAGTASPVVEPAYLALNAQTASRQRLRPSGHAELQALVPGMAGSENVLAASPAAARAPGQLKLIERSN